MARPKALKVSGSFRDLQRVLRGLDGLNGAMFLEKGRVEMEKLSNAGIKGGVSPAGSAWKKTKAGAAPKPGMHGNVRSYGGDRYFVLQTESGVSAFHNSGASHRPRWAGSRDVYKQAGLRYALAAGAATRDGWRLPARRAFPTKNQGIPKRWWKAMQPQFEKAFFDQVIGGMPQPKSRKSKA